MLKTSLLLFLLAISASTIKAQSFQNFISQATELQFSKEKNLKENLSFLEKTVTQKDASTFLKEQKDTHSLIGKYTLSKYIVVIYYTKPENGAPIGKITAITFTNTGKFISSEAIGVYADYTGMHFNLTFTASTQSKGSLSLSSHVQAFKETGEPNDFLSKLSIYIISSKGKITKA